MSTYITWSGGGARGLRSLQAGKYIERVTGKPLQQLVDGFAGTSTGGIIALALAMRQPLSCAQLESFYLRWLPKIFASPWYAKTYTVFGLKRPKYNGVALREACAEVFGTRTMGDSPVECVITTFNMTEGCPVTLRDRNHMGRFWLCKDAAIATSAGPTFLPPHRDRYTGDCYIDGGVYANNPSLEVPRGATAVLHLGTGLTAHSWAYADVCQWGELQWLRPILDVLQDGVMADVESRAFDLWGPAYLSIDSVCTNGAMDDVSPENLAKLIADGEELVETKKDDINRWVETYCKGRY